MWFNDIDMKLCYLSWSRRVESVASGRHRVALDRYLERKRRREVERRRYEFEAKFETMRDWVEALTARSSRRIIRAKPLNWRDHLLKRRSGDQCSCHDRASS